MTYRPGPADLQPYLDNIKREVMRELTWIAPDLQVALLRATIDYCNVRLAHLQTGQPLQVKKTKTRQGSGK